MQTIQKLDNGQQLIRIMSLILLTCAAAVAVTFYFGGGDRPPSAMSSVSTLMK